MIMHEKHLKEISYVLMFFFIALIIPLHLFPCFIAGLLTYEITIFLTPYFEYLVGSSHARWVAVTLIAASVFITVTLSVVILVNLLTSDIQHSIDINTETSHIFANIKAHIPNYLLSFIPESSEELKNQLFALFESNLIVIHDIGRSFLHGLITIFIGLIIGAMVSLNKTSCQNTYFVSELTERLYYFSKAFRNIILSQFKVSIINTILTSIVLLVLFPIFGVRLPLGKTLILATFIFGLLPIIGNIISNFMIIIAALSVSLSLGLITTIYLIFIHKLEYFLNAEIVGSRIGAKSWELLLVMLIFESAFGIEGLVAGPIYYSYLKAELRALKIIS